MNPLRLSSTKFHANDCEEKLSSTKKHPQLPSEKMLINETFQYIYFLS